jgi:HTH-type transcriptional regulator / antitoxin HipB
MTTPKMYPIQMASQLSIHIKALRKHCGWTQAELGQRIGVKQVRIAEIESDPSVVSIEQILHMIHVMGFDLCISERIVRKSSAGEW